MKYHFKIPAATLERIREDLARPHEHAWERVGFLRAGLGASRDEIVILAGDYAPVADHDYERCWSVGAKINSEAIRKALAWADGWRGGILHVHAHEGRGKPRFSPDDHEGNQRLIPSFFNTAPSGIHGAIVLGDELMTGVVWPDKSALPVEITRFTVIDAPLTRYRYEQA